MASIDIIPTGEAAHQLGIPANALRLYLRSIGLFENPENEETISQTQLDEIHNEIRSRAANLRLDELARISLTNEWLATAAIHNLESIATIRPEISAFESGFEAKIANLSDNGKIELLTERLAKCESSVAKSLNSESGQVMSHVASLQHMIETQSREIDLLRNHLNELKKVLVDMDQSITTHNARHERLMAGLRQAIDDPVSPPIENSIPKGNGARSAAPKSEPIQTPARTPEAPIEVPSESAPVDPETDAKARFKNNKPITPLKYGVLREIEYNFLLERMGYKRIDDYDSNFKGDILVPNDDQIKEFLSSYELGCEIDEVEFVTVQRGDYQMIQYKRGQKSTGLKGWMPSKRKT